MSVLLAMWVLPRVAHPPTVNWITTNRSQDLHNPRIPMIKSDAIGAIRMDYAAVRMESVIASPM